MRHTKKWLLMHHANRDLTIAASCLLKTDNHCMILTENWPWPYHSEYWACRKFGRRNFFFTGNIWKFKPLLYGIGIFKENCMKLSGRNLFWNWYIDRKLKLTWNHGVLTTRNWLSLHYTFNNFGAEFFFDRKNWNKLGCLENWRC